MPRLRGVCRPPLEWAASSSGPKYASVSTMRPRSSVPPSNRRTKTCGQSGVCLGSEGLGPPSGPHLPSSGCTRASQVPLNVPSFLLCHQITGCSHLKLWPLLGCKPALVLAAGPSITLPPLPRVPLNLLSLGQGSVAGTVVSPQWPPGILQSLWCLLNLA